MRFPYPSRSFGPTHADKGSQGVLSPVFEFTGYESDLTKFTSLENPTDVTLIADPTGTAGSTNVVSVHFPPYGASGTTYDANKSANIVLASPTDHIYIRAKYFMKSPESDGNYGGQRKRFYLTDLGGVIIHGTLSGDTIGSLPQNYQGYYIYDQSGVQHNSYASTSDNGQHFDTWMHLDYEYFTGTSGADNGWARVWIDGVLDANDLIGISPAVVGTWTNEGWQIVKVGRQLDTYNMTTGHAIAAWTSCTVSRTGGVATITAQASQQYISSLVDGKDIIVTGFADTSFNGIQTVTSSTASTFVYSNAGGDTTSTGGRVILQGNEYRYWTHIQVYAIPAGMTYLNVPSEAGLGFR